MAYATPEQMIVRYDARRLGQLVRDDGSTTSTSDLVNDQTLMAMLDDASGMVNQACRTGNRYTLDHLSQVATDSKTQGPLVRLVCDLAWGLLWARRGLPAGQFQDMAPRYAEGLALLEKLRYGQLVFDLPGHVLAHNPDTAVLASNAEKTNPVSGYTRIWGLRAEDEMGTDSQPGRERF